MFLSFVNIIRLSLKEIVVSLCITSFTQLLNADDAKISPFEWRAKGCKMKAGDKGSMKERKWVDSLDGAP